MFSFLSIVFFFCAGGFFFFFLKKKSTTFLLYFIPCGEVACRIKMCHLPKKDIKRKNKIQVCKNKTKITWLFRHKDQTNTCAAKEIIGLEDRGAEKFCDRLGAS